MKRIKYLLLIISLFLFAPVVYAENLTTFFARVDFAYNVDQSKINNIIALMEIPGEEDFREIELKRSDLFHFESTDIPVASQFDSAYVEGDKTGTYVVTGKLTKTSYKTGELVINVSLANGGSTTTTTAQEVGGDDIIIIGDDGKVETTQPTSNVSNITSSTKETTISKAAKERQELYKYVIFVVIGLLVFVILIVIVKVIRTSNLM